MFDRATLFLEICSCGNSCRHCYIPEHRGRFKNLAMVRSILDNFSTVLDSPAVTKKAQLYFHDDPTLHPDIVDILRYATVKGLSICPTLSTNGMGLARRKDGRDILKVFIDCGIKGLQLSLYGDEEYHDWFAGRVGSFNDRRLSAKMAQEAGLWVCWSLFLTRDNPGQLVKLARELGTNKTVKISFPGPSEQWTRHPAIHPKLEQYEFVRRQIPEYLPENCYPNSTFLFALHSESEWMAKCRSGENMAKYLKNDEPGADQSSSLMWLMESNGDLFDSERCLAAYKVGNVHEYSLRDVYQESRHSRGYLLLEKADSCWLAAQAGDLSGETISTLNGMRDLWAARILTREVMPNACD